LTKPLNAELFAAFSAAGIDHITPPGGFHSGAEAVGADALDFAGLIRSFHRGCALNFSGMEKQQKDLEF
jgi:hypothetical protein